MSTQWIHYSNKINSLVHKVWKVKGSNKQNRRYRDEPIYRVPGCSFYITCSTHHFESFFYINFKRNAIVSAKVTNKIYCMNTLKLSRLKGLIKRNWIFTGELWQTIVLSVGAYIITKWVRESSYITSTKKSYFVTQPPHLPLKQ